MPDDGHKFFVSVQYSWLVEACGETGDVETARRYAAHVLLRARHGERLGEAAVSRTLASIAAEAGDDADCRRWIRRAEFSARLRGSRRETALNDLLRAELGKAPQDIAAAQADLRALGMNWHAGRAKPVI